MEPQGRGNVPARHTPKRNKRLGLSKTTLESRVHVQTSWAECRDKKVSASSRRRDFSLDIPFYRTSPVPEASLRAAVSVVREYRNSSCAAKSTHSSSSK